MKLKISAIRASAAATKYAIIVLLGIFNYSQLVIDYGIILAYSGLLSIIVGADLYYYFFKIRHFQDEIDLRHFYIISLLSIVFVAPLWVVKADKAFYLLPILIFLEVICIELQRYINVIKGTQVSAYFIFARSIIPFILVMALIKLDQLTTWSLIAALIIGNIASLLMFIDTRIQFTHSKFNFTIEFFFAAISHSIVFFVGSLSSRFILVSDRLTIDYITPNDVTLENYVNTAVIASMTGIVFEIFVGQFLVRTIFKDANVTLCTQQYSRIKTIIITFCLIVIITSVPTFYTLRFLGIKITGLETYLMIVLIQILVICLGVTQQLLYRLGAAFYPLILSSSIVLLAGTTISYLSLILHHKIFVCLMMVITLSIISIAYRLLRIEFFLRAHDEV